MEANIDTPIGVRQKRKAETRARLQRTATALFEERGYDTVTIAEIAKAAGVSSKTLFQHFPAKEDLLVSELADVHQELIDALRNRDRRKSPLEAVTDWIAEWDANRPADGVERFWRLVGESPNVMALRRRLYEDWENQIVEVLADEANEARPTPRTRMIAATLVSFIRVLTSKEVRDSLERLPPEERRPAFDRLLEDAAALLADGIHS